MKTMKQLFLFLSVSAFFLFGCSSTSENKDVKSSENKVISIVGTWISKDKNLKYIFQENGYFQSFDLLSNGSKKDQLFVLHDKGQWQKKEKNILIVIFENSDVNSTEKNVSYQIEILDEANLTLIKSSQKNKQKFNFIKEL